MTFADGKSYDGEWAEGKPHGKVTYTLASGEVEVGCYEAGADVGQGVKWSADRTEAWKLQAGQVEFNCYEADARVGQGVCWSADRTEAWELQAGKKVRGIPLDEAAQIAERIGLPPP